MIDTLDNTLPLETGKYGAVRARESNNKTRLFAYTTIYAKALFWIALLPFLAVTKSWADTLPDFSALVEEEGDAVVKISVLTESVQSGQSGIPGFDLEQMPEQFRRFFEQLPQNPSPQPRQGPDLAAVSSFQTMVTSSRTRTWSITPRKSGWV